eukprot:scaffold10098_cov96-Cylindrotheca_fusiformis.AAC.2
MIAQGLERAVEARMETRRVLPTAKFVCPLPVTQVASDSEGKRCDLAPKPAEACRPLRAGVGTIKLQRIAAASQFSIKNCTGCN